MAFNNAAKSTTVVNSYLSIVATTSQESMTVILSTNGKNHKELRYNNRQTTLDITPVLNMVVEREKQGWELYNNSITYDTKNSKMVYMFLLRKKGVKWVHYKM